MMRDISVAQQTDKTKDRPEKLWEDGDMTDLEKEVIETHKEQIDKYRDENEEIRITQDPDFIKEAGRCLTVLNENFKGFLVGLYRSPKVPKIVYVVLIVIGIAQEFHVYSLLPEYREQVTQGITDWKGWEQKAKEPERAVYSNRFLIIGDDHTHEGERVENLKAGTVVSSISGSNYAVFDYYRKI